jgi:branched-chain amino acid transport system substrate-binding protein
VEAMREFPHSREHPQGPKIFNGKTHQAFGHQHISRVENGRLNRVYTSSIEDTFYPDETDYTQQSF